MNFLFSSLVGMTANILIPETFYQPKNATIFRACLGLSGRNQPIDGLTVMEELRRTGELEKAGGAEYIASLTMQVASAANIEHHARLLAQFHIRRELALAGMEIEQWAMDPTVDDLHPLDMAEARIFGIAQRYARGSEPPKERQIVQALGYIKDRETGEKILLLVRQSRYGRHLKKRKSGKDGSYFEAEEEFLHFPENTELLTALKEGIPIYV